MPRKKQRTNNLQIVNLSQLNAPAVDHVPLRTNTAGRTCTIITHLPATVEEPMPEDLMSDVPLALGSSNSPFDPVPEPIQVPGQTHAKRYENSVWETTSYT
jgi:hypothetical protein